MTSLTAGKKISSKTDNHVSVRFLDRKQKDIFNGLAVHPLQCWEWGDFRKATGNDVIRLGVYKNNKLMDVLQIIIHNIPKVKYKIATLIRGPAMSPEVLPVLRKIGKENNFLFIKFEPFLTKSTGSRNEFDNQMKLFKENGCVPGKTLFTPTSFWIDLEKSEEELLESFNSKTRYNIRVALKKGVKIKEDNSDRAFEKYIKLTRETVIRQGFYAHSEKYHRLMWKYLNGTLSKKSRVPIARLLTARLGTKIISAWIVFVWHDFLYYPYGASTDKYKNTMANNLIMWEAIRYGKKLGLKTFDLWGREPGKGFTRFKEGYSPQVVEFIGTWDFIISPLYYLYRPAEKIRWFLLKTKSKFTKPAF